MVLPFHFCGFPPPATRLRISSTCDVVHGCLATGAGLEPASPGCTGALAIELPCLLAGFALGLALLDLCDEMVRSGVGSLCDEIVHTGAAAGSFRMCDEMVRGV